MIITPATDEHAWDSFLGKQRFRPFLQSWTMGEVYRATGEEPVRLLLKECDTVIGICQGIVVDAKRGRHIAILYGPVVSRPLTAEERREFSNTLKDLAREKRCSFIRMSPFLPAEASAKAGWPMAGSIASPLHLLAEHLWYLPLTVADTWETGETGSQKRTEEELLSRMRKTTRNLIRRAEKEGVTIEASKDPLRDIAHFLKLHEETRKRHKFTPYTDAFFWKQVELFSTRKECTLYLARYNGEVIASSIHMHAFGETSYHHGASTHAYDKIPASYLLQWTALKDALARGDHVYNFWGIAPGTLTEDGFRISNKAHPFAGVTTFKTGYGGSLLNLTHCMDIPVRASYRATRTFEMLRKWRRGF